TSSPPASKRGPYDRAPALHALAAGDDRQRHARVRPDHRRAAALAALGDDERVPRRRYVGHLAGGGGQRLLPRAQRRTAPLPVRDRPHPMIASLHPAYFALVMATGIVSIACALVGMPTLGAAFLWPNTAFYVVLWTLTSIRIARYRDRVVADLSHHGRAVG